MNSSSTVKTNILVISDTHCAALNQDGSALPLPKADLLVHCGDLTYTGKMEEYAKALDMIKTIDAPVKVVIAGNHDLTLDSDFVFGHMKMHNLTHDQADTRVREAKELWGGSNSRAKQEGITFLDEGFHQIDLSNGSRVSIYSSPYTPEFQDWGFPYTRDEDRFNSSHETLVGARNIGTNPVPSFVSTSTPVDIMVTHGPPYANLDRTFRGDHVGCEHLLRATMRARPLLHCFGHIHEGWGAEIVRWSKNADEVATSQTTLEDWRKGAWKAGVEARKDGATSIQVVSNSVGDESGARIDLSQGSNNLLERGKETLMINAAIMDIHYKPVNAPFLITIDLSKAD